MTAAHPTSQSFKSNARAALTDLISREHLEQTIREAVPPGTEDLNLRAFSEGWEAAQGA